MRRSMLGAIATYALLSVSALLMVTPVLFMIIVGGLGSVLGSFLGAGFVVLMPILIKNILVDGFALSAVFAKHVEITAFGVLIIFFLIVEPHGLARLWQIIKEKLRLWPFPH